MFARIARIILSHVARSRLKIFLARKSEPMAKPAKKPMARTAKKVLKKPSAASEEVKKKPASWQDFAQHGDDDDDRDTSAITKQQRYVFDKALKAGHLH